MWEKFIPYFSLIIIVHLQHFYLIIILLNKNDDFIHNLSLFHSLKMVNPILYFYFPSLLRPNISASLEVHDDVQSLFTTPHCLPELDRSTPLWYSNSSQFYSGEDHLWRFTMIFNHCPIHQGKPSVFVILFIVPPPPPPPTTTDLWTKLVGYLQFGGTDSGNEYMEHVNSLTSKL